MTRPSDIANPPTGRKEFAWPHGAFSRVARRPRPKVTLRHVRLAALGLSPAACRSLIREDAERLGRPDVDLRHVEAYMRLERGTLEHLSRIEFLNEVIVAIHCLDTAGPEAANQLADSLGLLA